MTQLTMIFVFSLETVYVSKQSSTTVLEGEARCMEIQVLLQTVH